MTVEKTFKAVNTWMQSIYKVRDQSIPVVIVGNKVDLEEERTVS